MAENITPNAVLSTDAINLWIRERIPLGLRKRVVLQKLMDSGRIIRGYGKEIEWRPTFKRRTMRASAVNPTNISMPVFSRNRVAKLQWKHGDVGEAVNLFDELVLENEGAFYQSAANRIQELTDDAIDSLCDWLYLDGSTAGAYYWDGLETLFGNSGLVSGGYVGNPSGTYAELNRALQYYGGSWTGTWPDGTGRPQYCAWSSIYVDWANTLFGTGTSLWKDNWQEAINFGLTFQEVLSRTKPDMLVLSPDLHRQVKDSLISNQTLEISSPGSKKPNVGSDPSAFGIEFTSEYGVPSNTCYGLATKEIEIRYLNRPGMPNQLIFQDEDKDINASQKLLALHTFSNLVFKRPIAQMKIGAITTPGS